MVYDRGDSFPLDFEPNRIPFGSKSKGKLSPRSYPIQCERKWKYSFLSVMMPLPDSSTIYMCVFTYYVCIDKTELPYNCAHRRTSVIKGSFPVDTLNIYMCIYIHTHILYTGSFFPT